MSLRGKVKGVWVVGFSLLLVLGCDEHSRLVRRAENGDPVAMRELGERIWANTSGRGDEVDEALSWLLRAAQKGDVKAMYKYALIHDAPGGEEKALYWFRKGAEAGDRFCCVKMGEAYRIGKYGLPVDFQESDRWFEAAELAKRKTERR